MKKGGKISVTHHLVKSSNKKLEVPYFTINLRIIAKRQIANFQSTVYKFLPNLRVEEEHYLEKGRQCLSDFEVSGKTFDDYTTVLVDGNSVELDLFHESIYLRDELRRIKFLLESLNIFENDGFNIKGVNDLVSINLQSQIASAFMDIRKRELKEALTLGGIIKLQKYFDWEGEEVSIKKKLREIANETKSNHLTSILNEYDKRIKAYYDDLESKNLICYWTGDDGLITINLNDSPLFDGHFYDFLECEGFKYFKSDSNSKIIQCIKEYLIRNLKRDMELISNSEFVSDKPKFSVYSANTIRKVLSSSN